MPEPDLPRLGRPRVNIHNTGRQPAASGLDNQLGGAETGPIAHGNVATALKSIRSIRAQIELFRGSSNGLRLEIRALEQDLRCVPADYCVLASHHAGEGD